MSASPGRPSARGGFVLAVVVVMLFAISVAAATAYLVAASEFTMARHSADGSEALALARSGLERFVAEQIGAVADSTTYALGDGFAVVTARRLFVEDSTRELYHVRSEGTVLDPRIPDVPARRVVGAYALRHRAPVREHAAVTISGSVSVAGGGQVLGQNAAPSGACWVASASTITGVITSGTGTESPSTAVNGSPDFDTWSGGYPQILDSLGVRWDVLTDPDFPLEFDDVWPSFSTLPADSFPIVRRWGWLSTEVVGRGVLIVPEVFDPGPGFHWQGIVLAGHVDDITQGRIDGILIGGLAGPNMYPTVQMQSAVIYDSCRVWWANRSLSYLQLLDDSLIEM